MGFLISKHPPKVRRKAKYTSPHLQHRSPLLTHKARRYPSNPLGALPGRGAAATGSSGAQKGAFEETVFEARTYIQSRGLPREPSESALEALIARARRSAPQLSPHQRPPNPPIPFGSLAYHSVKNAHRPQLLPNSDLQSANSAL